MIRLERAPGPGKPWWSSISHSLTVLSLAVAAIIAMIGPLSTAGRAQQATGPLYDVRANQDTTADQHEPTLAVDPTNPNIVLAAAKDWRTGPKQVWYYRSTDAGKTWVDGHIDTFPTELPNQSDPVIAFDANGGAYMAVLAYNQNDLTIGGLFISRSPDKGVTWQTPVLVSSNDDQIFNDKEWLTIDRSSAPTRGNIYTSWTLFTKTGPRSERGDIVVSRSTDGGQTFSRRVVASLPNQSTSQGSYPVVGPNGELYVLYYSGVGALEEEEGGAEGDAAQEASQVAFQSQPADSALYVAKSTDGGQTFPQVKRAASVITPRSPLPGSQFRIFVLPTLAVDPKSAALYATWNDYTAGDTDTMIVRSTDGGSTWGNPVRVNDDPVAPRHDQFFPTAVVGADGSVGVLWLDRRDDPQNVRYQPYYARSTDGGQTFSRNAPVSRASSDPSIGFEGSLIGDYLGLDVSADGSTVYAAWPDTRGGNQDIYFSRFSTEDGPNPPAAPPGAQQPTPAAAPSPQPLTGFTDEAFLKTWELADRAVATGRASRPWLWGPVSFAAANEPYAEGTTGTREVQYFDKARMEINNLGGDRNNPFFVTNGLLVVELISGRIQMGNVSFDPVLRSPSSAPVAGDANSPDALTYASLYPVASLNNDNKAPDRTGQEVTASLNSRGQVGVDPTQAGKVKIARYESVLGHNIPDVFWRFMNSTGPVYNGRFDTYSDGPIVNWVTDLGYPITEAYWTTVKVGGVQKSVLVQAFQRRVLTYVADNPNGWQVEMGNVGRHYFDWRYRNPTAAPPAGGRR